jgi:flagellar basal-body rod modification protein FlgD
VAEIDPFAGLRSFPTQEAAARSDSGGNLTLAQAGLDRDSFLTIFLAQLEHQDPLSPQDASELGAQLAVFSQLEQQIQMADELRGVNQRLDDLVAQGAPQDALSPVSLIGRTVEAEASHLRAPLGGESSSALLFQLDADDAGSLLLEGTSDSGESLGAAALRASDGGALPSGSYALRFDAGQLTLTGPGGSVTPLQFGPVRREADGRLVLVDPSDPQAEPITAPRAGVAYRFSALAQRSTGETLEVPSFVSGAVQAVRVVEGRPRVAVGDVEVDPARIVRVQ